MLNININKLRSEVEDREHNKIKVYEKILDMCYKKILNTNKQYNDYSCTFVVPNVVFGLPLYNIEDCIIFIMNKLVEKGFEIYFALPTSIHIFWRPKDYINKNQNNKLYLNSITQNQLEYYSSLQPQNKLMIKYNDIYNNNKNNDKNNEYNENNEYNTNTIKSHKNNNNINQSKNYRPIETYQTTSHSIYDLDNLDIFQNKVEHLL